MKILIIVAMILLTVGVKWGIGFSSFPESDLPFNSVFIAHLVLLDHGESHPIPCPRKTVSTSDKLKPNPLVPRVLPSRVGLW